MSLSPTGTQYPVGALIYQYNKNTPFGCFNNLSKTAEF